ncbi:MAG: DNA/RNA non-specific endonuclease [Pseudomonadota bacterium]
MIKRKDLDARRHQIRLEAGQRWLDALPSVIDATEKLSHSSPLETATPAQRERYVARELRKASRGLADVGLERKIGPTLDFDEVAPSQDAQRAGRPVARIVDLFGNGRIGAGFATGFLVHGPLLITNWHIFAEPGDAQGMGAQFGFEVGPDGLIQSGTVFELDPERFFYSDPDLDIAIVGIGGPPFVGEPGASLADYGSVRLIPVIGKILVGQRISIIQHPDGLHKQWAVRQNKLLREPGPLDDFLEYNTDTLPGSSGAPAFNKDWELVAVHHSGVPRVEDDQIRLRNGDPWSPGDPDSAIHWVANKGARVSKIVAHLKNVSLPNAAQQAMLSSLISHSKDDLEGGIAFMQDNQGIERRPARLDHHGAGGPTIIVHGNAEIHFHNTDAAHPATTAVPGAPEAPQPSGVERKIRFDPDYAGREGYQDDFLEGFTIPVPRSPTGAPIPHGSGQKILRYHHYSLAMHKQRRFALWAAANVDYDEAKRFRTRDELGDDTWKTDPRIAGELQIEGRELYDPAKKFDQGHLIRRDSIAWGHTLQEEEFANSDSFHFTNCTPQHEEFNRAIFRFKGIWGKLEAYIEKQSRFVGRKLNVIAGPILDANDPWRDFGVGVDIQIPIGFWKIVVVVEEVDGERTLRAYGFILSQQKAIDDFGWEGRFQAGKFHEQQASLAQITAATGVTFPKVLHDADPRAVIREESASRPLLSFDDIDLG